MLPAMLFAVKEERNKCFLGGSQNTSLLSSSPLGVNPFCCQGASCQLPVTPLAKGRANDSTMLLTPFKGDTMKAQWWIMTTISSICWYTLLEIALRSLQRCMQTGQETYTSNL